MTGPFEADDPSSWFPSEEDLRATDDAVGKAIRLAYAKAVPELAPHIDANSWENLTPDRKAKWLAMARAAQEVIGL